MLSNEDNAILTSVGPGTLMGNLFRQYWLPVLMSSEIAEPDGPPKRVRILGEDLIAFRSTNGEVGLLANHCPHRGASLFFGRNEEGGLRCVYHGWKFDTDGRCVDMPNEPPESTFKDKIRHLAYPCREQNGAVWTYMGPRSEAPPFPELEWTQLPEGHYVLGKMLRECNWAQAFEGDIDDVHVSFLHSRLSVPTGSQMARLMHTQRSPHLEVLETAGGAMYGVRREANEEEYNWRIKHFLFPSMTVVNGGIPGALFGQIWVPMDDEHTMQWRIYWTPAEPLPEPLRQGGAAMMIDFLPNTTDSLGQWRTKANKRNDYLLDYEVQRTVAFCGIASVPVQDKAVQESMGAIQDRTTEHLGRTDAMITMVRRRLIGAAKALRDRGAAPPGVDQPDLYAVRSAVINLPKAAHWVEQTRDVVRAFTDLPVAIIS